MRDFTASLADGAEVWSNNGRVHYRYNARLKVAGDSVKLMFFEHGVTCGYTKNSLDGEQRERAVADYDDAAKEQRYYRTGLNARRRLYDAVAANLHKHTDCNGKRQGFKFLTLTYRNDITSLDESNKIFKGFIQRLNYHFAPEGGQWLRYVAVPELQTTNGRNVWHYHVLFFNLPFLPVSGEIVDKLIGQGALHPSYDKRDTIAYIWGQGGVDVCKVDFADGYDVAGYISKYVSKGLNNTYAYATGAGLLRKKRYLHSKGLAGPKLMIAFLTKQQRQAILTHFAAKSKHYKRKGELGKYFETWCVDTEYVGRIFGIDLRAAKKHVTDLQDMFDRYSYGFA